MEFYCKLRVNDINTGKVLFKADAVIVDDKSMSRDEFERHHYRDVRDYFIDQIPAEINLDDDNTIILIDCVMLEQDYDNSEDNSEDEDGESEYNQIEHFDIEDLI